MAAVWVTWQEAVHWGWGGYVQHREAAHSVSFKMTCGTLLFQLPWRGRNAKDIPVESFLRLSSLTMYGISSPERKMNPQIIGVYFLLRCTDIFPPCAPSHFLHLIAFIRKTGPRRSLTGPQLQNWSSFKMCVNLQKRGFHRKAWPSTAVDFTKPSVFWIENGFPVLAFGCPSPEPSLHWFR